MQLAEELLAAYAAAGFVKLHLDASMACLGDPPRLDDRLIAERAARLCRAAESAGQGAQIVYVIGTEVPVPGGATEALDHVEVTSVDAARQTLAIHEQAFADAGLQDAWPRVIDYEAPAAAALSHMLDGQS